MDFASSRNILLVRDIGVVRPHVGSCDSLHHGRAQSIGAQPGRINGEHLMIELDNRADASLPAQEFCQIVMVGANKQAYFITQSHLPAVAGNLGLGVGINIDPAASSAARTGPRSSPAP